MLGDRDFLARCRETFGPDRSLSGHGHDPFPYRQPPSCSRVHPGFRALRGADEGIRNTCPRHSPAGYTLTTRAPSPMTNPHTGPWGEAPQGVAVLLQLHGRGRRPPAGDLVLPAELVVHPSLGGDGWRVAELETLLAGSFRAVLDEEGDKARELQGPCGLRSGILRC
jgi:hypothetical protein